MSKSPIPATFTKLAVAIACALPLGVNASPISNTVSDNSITIDANIDDWSNIASIGYDAKTLADVNAEADFLEGWMAHDSNSLYLAYRNNGDISTTAWWSWQVYIDTDDSESTGFKGIGSVGAEYLLQGGSLYKYTGSGTDWSWQYVSGITSKVNGAIAEFKIPRDALGSPSKFRAVFKARNGAFTGDYSDSGMDTYPKSFTPLSLHDDLLFRQSAIYSESGGILPMSLSNSVDAGASLLEMTASHPLIDGQLITYRATNREYYTAHIDTVNGSTITLKEPLKAAINAGQNVWNFYQDDAHPHLYGYRAMADFAIREIGIRNLNTGRHVLLGDSWFDSPWVAERLALRLGNATIINKGIGGNKSGDMLNRFDSDIASQNPDFVWVNAGLNDAYGNVPAATYLTNMQGILAKISSIGAQAKVFDPAVAQLFYGNDETRQLSHSYAKALSAIGGDGSVDYEFGAVVPPAETGVVSNSKSISIDGDLSDWEELQSFGADGNDINEAGARADILEAWMAHDDSAFYMAYRNDGNIDQSTWWPWQAYLDTDNDESTGFKIGNGVGANYVIQGDGLYRYIGSGSDWAWQYVASANKSVNGSVAELAFPRSAIGNPSSLSAVIKARNGIFTGNYAQSGIDSHPDVGDGHFNYKFSGDSVDSTVFSNPLGDLSINLDGNLADWSATTSFGRDPDDITDATTQADWLEAWAAHDSNNLYFAYENDGDISSVSWPWQIYIDTDNDPSTGYQVSNSMGAEFILEGSSLRSYGGSGSNWSWSDIAVADSSTIGSISEIAIPRSALGELTGFRVMFRANNQPFTDSFDPSGVDYFPNNAATSAKGYLSYSIE